MLKYLLLLEDQRAEDTYCYQKIVGITFSSKAAHWVRRVSFEILIKQTTKSPGWSWFLWQQLGI